jgi:hypothetical protein
MFFGGDPFEHFAGMHGGGGSRRGSGGMRGGPQADVDTTKLYETLGVSRSDHCLYSYFPSASSFIYISGVHGAIKKE